MTGQKSHNDIKYRAQNWYYKSIKYMNIALIQTIPFAKENLFPETLELYNILSYCIIYCNFTSLLTFCKFLYKIYIFLREWFILGDLNNAKYRCMTNLGGQINLEETKRDFRKFQKIHIKPLLRKCPHSTIILQSNVFHVDRKLPLGAAHHVVDHRAGRKNNRDAVGSMLFDSGAPSLPRPCSIFD